MPKPVAPGEKNSYLTVGAIARETGLTVRALHHYDATGLLPSCGRTPSGYRLYESAVVERLHVIARFRDLGLPLKQIQRALDGDSREVEKVVREHLTEVEDRITVDYGQRKRLLDFLHSCERDNDPMFGSNYSDRVVTFGAVYSLKGLGRSYGISSRNAILLAQDMINLAGGIRGAHLSVDIVDDATDKMQASVQTRKLIQERSVLGLLGPGISHLAVAAHSVANALRTPMIATSTPGLHIVGHGCPYRRDFIFRTSMGEDAILRSSIESYLEQVEAGTGVLLCTNDDKYSADSAEIISGNADQYGIRLIDSIEFSKAVDDFSPFAARAVRQDPDVMFIASVGDLPARLMRSARRLGFRGRFVGGQCFNALSVARAAGKAGLGALSSNSWHLGNDVGNNREFVDEYRRRFDCDPDQMAAQAYAGMLILADAAARACLTFDDLANDRLRLRSALEATRTTTPFGDTRFTDGHDIELDTYLVTMDGRSGQTLVESRKAS